MLGVKDKGILLQITKRCNRVIEKVSNISETEFSLNEDTKEVVCFNLFQIGELANVGYSDSMKQLSMITSVGIIVLIIIIEIYEFILVITKKGVFKKDNY